ncbi:hypothetical protein XU18_2875 [Perkinsela sp. CCAP 1560/4]|nr:hypothetical protein XU18_2875 [Perkinsela sp. CCAP 1560/4]|eukprot:KNH06370.1 hypothetical protein XU18_2875 [Perkinsela sp. CCAP 1560/4]
MLPHNNTRTCLSWALHSTSQVFPKIAAKDSLPVQNMYPNGREDTDMGSIVHSPHVDLTSLPENCLFTLLQLQPPPIWGKPTLFKGASNARLRTLKSVVSLIDLTCLP